MTSDRIVHVPLGDRAYDIVIGTGLLETAGERLKAKFPGRRFGIVTDTEVAKAQLPRLKRALDAAGVGSAEIVLPNGEATKWIAKAHQPLPSCERRASGCYVDSWLSEWKIGRRGLDPVGME